MAQRMWCLLTEAATEMRLDHTLRNGQTFTWTRLPPNLASLPFIHSKSTHPSRPESYAALQSNLPSKIEVAYLGGVENPLDESPHSECVHCLVETYFQVSLPHICNAATTIDRLSAESVLDPVTSRSVVSHAHVRALSPTPSQVRSETSSVTSVCTSPPIASSSTTTSRRAPFSAVTPSQAERTHAHIHTDHTHIPPLHRGACSKINTSLTSLYAQWAYSDYYTYCRASAISGVRILRQPVGECTVEFICSANNHLQRITAMVQKIAKEWGQELGMLILMKNPDAENIAANLEMAYARAKGYQNEKEKEAISENSSNIKNSEFRMSSVSDLSLGQAHVSHAGGRAHEMWGKSVVNGVVSVPGEANLDNKGKTGGKPKKSRKQAEKNENSTDSAGLLEERSANTVEDGDMALHGLLASWEWIWAPALPFPERMLENSEDPQGNSRKVYYPWLPTPSENTITIPLYSFPESQDLGNLQEDIMRNSGFGYRAKYLQESGKIMSQEGWEESIYSEGEAAWEKTLQQLESGEITPSGKPVSGKKTKKPKTVRVGSGSEKPHGNGIKEESLVATHEASEQNVKQDKNTFSLASSATVSCSPLSCSTSSSRLSSPPVSTSTSSSLATSASPYLAHLRQRVIGEAHAHSLMRLPGVGRKVADCIRLFALGDADAIPVDTHVLGTALGRHASAIAWHMCRLVVEAEERQATGRRKNENLGRMKTEECVLVKNEEEGRDNNTYSDVSSTLNTESVSAAGTSLTATTETATTAAPAASSAVSTDSHAAHTSVIGNDAAEHNTSRASNRNVNDREAAVGVCDGDDHILRRGTTDMKTMGVRTQGSAAGDGKMSIRNKVGEGEIPSEYSHLPRLLDIARRVCNKAGLLMPSTATAALCTNATNTTRTDISTASAYPSTLTSTSTAYAAAVADDSDATEPEVIVDKKRKKIGKKGGSSGKSEKTSVPEYLPEIYHGLWRAMHKLYGNVWLHASYHIPSLADLCGPYDATSPHLSVCMGRYAGSDGLKQEPVDCSSSQDTLTHAPQSVLEPSTEQSEKAVITCLNLPYPKNPQTVYQLLTNTKHEIPCPIATIAEAKDVGANAVYEGINEFYRELWGDKCGWAHSVLFTGELSVHKESQKGANQ